MEVLVYIDAYNITDAPLFLGTLKVGNIRGKEVFSFRASKDWLSNKAMSFIDADLKPFLGNQYAPQGKNNFGLFLDSCPDRWGRVLMQRRERIRAKDENRAARHLHEVDYLLGVYDESRMGALRYKLSTDGEFLDNDPKLATPPIASIRALEQASLNYEHSEAENSNEYRKWLQMLYMPGSSLGGARPKANVVDGKGNMWIAKFPSRLDSTDVGAWEYVVTLMARDFGLKVPEVKAGRYSSQYHTFLSKRFDRNGEKRLHFASAMTLLGYADGNDAADGVSYLEMAEFLRRFGTTNLQEDLRELWKRVAFNIAISNCDDHLRNHGFILTPKGWTLSPVYDLTPNPDGIGLKLNITEADNSLSFELLRQTAPFYGLEQDEAASMLKSLATITKRWRLYATTVGISRDEQEHMSRAFKTGG